MRGPPSDFREHDPDLKKCIECGSQYDLARQDYHGPRCPSCRRQMAT